jgi:PBP superfamily domain
MLLSKKALGAVCAASLTLAVAGSAVADARPAPAPPGQVVIAAAGADATLVVSGALFDPDEYQYNVPTLPATPYLVPGDANCSDVAYVTASPGPGQAIAPVSAGTGLNLLKVQKDNPVGQKGCIDIARSSAPPRGLANDNATFEYYAFALDAVSWASPSLYAPATLTRQQIKDIYTCVITDWSQVPGGGSGPIQRYFTQPGSGTGSFFQSDILDGLNPDSFPASPTPSCPPVVHILQSQGKTILPGDQQKAILPYSVGGWIFQANNHVNPTLDVRNGVQLGGITSGAINGNAAAWNSAESIYQLDSADGGVVLESNVKLNNPTPAYPGIRYMYNTIDSATPNYAEAFAIVGFQNVSVGAIKSPLCNGDDLSALLSFGFAPLSTTGGGANNLAGSTCRKFVNS